MVSLFIWLRENLLLLHNHLQLHLPQQLKQQILKVNSLQEQVQVLQD
jgi:hypothetical protein